MVAIIWLNSARSHGHSMEQRKVGKAERAEIKSKKAVEESGPHPRKVPQEVTLEVLGEPHFLHQYAAKPLVERGYLQVSATTDGRRLVLANLLTSTAKGAPAPAVKLEPANGAAEVGFAAGTGKWRLAVSRGETVSLDEWSSDGLLLALGPDGSLFAADASYVARNGLRIIDSPERFAAQVRSTTEALAGVIRLEAPALVKVDAGRAPVRTLLNGRPAGRFAFRTQTGLLGLNLAAGESRIEVIHER